MNKLLLSRHQKRLNYFQGLNSAPAFLDGYVVKCGTCDHEGWVYVRPIDYTDDDPLPSDKYTGYVHFMKLIPAKKNADGTYEPRTL